MTDRLRRPHDLGEIIGLAYAVYARNFRVLFLIAIIVAPLQMLAAVTLRAIDSDATATGVYYAFLLPQAVVGFIATAAVVHAVADVADARSPDPARSLDATLARAATLLGTYALAFSLAFAAFFAFPFLALWWLVRRRATIDGGRNWWLVLPVVLPVYLAVRWVFVPQTVMLRDLRRWAALDASADAVRGQWWRVFGTLVTIALIQAGPLLIAAAFRSAPPLVDATITSFAAALVLPFTAAAQTLLWYDLTTRKSADAGPA